MECEGPNKRLYEFTGNIQLKSAEQLEPIQSDQILLRGAQLRNTEWIYGLVIYSGHDSKLLQNASRAPLKRSRMDHITNKQVHQQSLAVQLLLSVIIVDIMLIPNVEHYSMVMCMPPIVLLLLATCIYNMTLSMAVSS